MSTHEIRGGFTTVDDCDDHIVTSARWMVRKMRRGGVYVTGSYDGEATFLHRVISKAKKGVVVDHVNGDGLDNQRSNLRLCTPSQNQQCKLTSRPRTNSAVRFRGVIAHGSKYVARISVDCKSFHLGSFKTEVEAALAYDSAARSMFGEFARPNFSEPLV